jgi:hypothetical protein
MAGNNPGQVLEVFRDALFEYTHRPDFHPGYEVQAAVYIGYDGQPLEPEEFDWENAAGLLLTMGDGSEYKLSLVQA